MAFTQSLTFCQTNNCQTLTVTDASNYGDTVSIGDVTVATLSILKYGGTAVPDINALDYIKTDLTGTVDATLGGTTLTGTLTIFNTELIVGNKILVGTYLYTVKSITSDTELEIMEAFGENVAGGTSVLINYDIVLTSVQVNGDALATYIDDGIYSIIYTITANAVDYVYEISTQFICQAECCLINKIANTTEEWLKDPCNTKNLDEGIFGYSLLQGLKTAAYSGSQTEFDTILAGIQQYCQFTTTGCSSCS